MTDASESRDTAHVPAPAPRAHARHPGLSTASTWPRLTAARDRLDVAQAERRRREDTALAQYAGAAGEADAVIARRDGVLAELDRRRHAVHDQAAAELAALEQRTRGGTWPAFGEEKGSVPGRPPGRRLRAQPHAGPARPPVPDRRQHPTAMLTCRRPRW